MKNLTKIAIIFTVDISCLFMATVLAYLFRFDFYLMKKVNIPHALYMMGLLVMCYAPLFFAFKLHRVIWRYAALSDMLKLTQSVAVGYVISSIIMYIVLGLHYVPLPILPLQAFFYLGLLLASRAFYRMYRASADSVVIAKKVLIIGAGQAGEGVLRDMLQHGERGYQPIGVVDDDSSLHNRSLRGVRVYGSIASLPEQVARLRPDMLVFAIPSLSDNKLLNAVYEICNQHQIPLRVLPGLAHLTEGRVNIDALKKVEIEDLLGRESVSIVNKQLVNRLQAKVVLVTGAGGSIGSELCRQIAANRPKMLVLLDNCENNLFQLQLELRDKFPQLDIALSLTDVSRKEEIEQCFIMYQPQIIFHAAAFKHVPMLEHQLFKAAKNNVLATQRLADFSEQYQVETFVLVSTDKAVNPTNVMGMTKRLAEIYCQAKNAHAETKFVTVRFGNVLGSNGSVLPLFRKQLAAGGPLTVTDPAMTRYFMMIPEAVTLILQSFLLGEGGEVFVLDMGDPVKIVDLAEKLIQLSGRRPYTDVDIKFTGIRPGEKLFEEIFHDREQLLTTPHAKILISNTRQYAPDRVQRLYQQMREAYHARDMKLLLSCMLQLVPEYSGRYAADKSVAVNAADISL